MKSAKKNEKSLKSLNCLLIRKNGCNARIKNTKGHECTGNPVAEKKI